MTKSKKIYLVLLVTASFVLVGIPLSNFSNTNADLNTPKSASYYYQDYYRSETVVVAAGSHFDIGFTASGKVGMYMETNQSDLSLTFEYIYEDTNYNNFLAGQPYTREHQEYEKHIVYYEYTFYSASYNRYYVYINDGSSDVEVDIILAKPEYIPLYTDTTADWKLTETAIEGGSYYEKNWDWVAGDQITADYKIWHENDSIDFFICNDDDFTTWQSNHAASITKYNSKESVIFSSFEKWLVPSNGKWHAVWYNPGADTVTFSAVVDNDEVTGSNFTHAIEIQAGDTVSGSLDSAQSIYYKVQMAEKKQFYVDTRDYDEEFTTTIYDPAQQVLSTAKGGSAVQNYFTPPSSLGTRTYIHTQDNPGYYYIQVSATSGAGNYQIKIIASTDTTDTSDSGGDIASFPFLPILVSGIIAMLVHIRRVRFKLK
ncbi:MAG: hypothetical protein ACTSU5_19225 [Promethearchaeota archaeon]